MAYNETQRLTPTVPERTWVDSSIGNAALSYKVTGYDYVNLQLVLDGTWPASLVMKVEVSNDNAYWYDPQTAVTFNSTSTALVTYPIEVLGFDYLRVRVSTSNGSIKIYPLVNGVRQNA